MNYELQVTSRGATPCALLKTGRLLTKSPRNLYTFTSDIHQF